MANLYEALGATLESATQNYANAHSAAVAEAIFPWVFGGVLFWITIMGYQILAGKMQEPVGTFIERCASIVFLTTLAFTPAIYQVEILNDFDMLQNALVSAFSGSSTTPYKAADVALQRGLDLAAEFSKETPVMDVSSALGWGAATLIIYIGTAVITLAAAGNIMVAKASMAVVLALGQAAIACAIFPATRKIFDAFMNTVLNRILTIAIITAVMGFAMDVFMGIAAGFNSSESEPLSFAFELLIAVVVMVFLMTQVGTIASELAGGVASTVGNPITKAASIAMAPMNKAAQYMTGRTTRTNARTGQQENATRMSHIMRGNTMANAAYRQKVGENMRSGWGPASGGTARKSGSSGSSSSGSSSSGSSGASKTAGGRVRAAAARYQERNANKGPKRL